MGPGRSQRIHPSDPGSAYRVPVDTELTLERAKTLISKDEASPWSDCVRAPPLWWWIYPRFEPATEAVFRRTLTTRDSDLIPLIAILLGGAWAAGITLTGVVESGNPAGLMLVVAFTYPAWKSSVKIGVEVRHTMSVPNESDGLKWETSISRTPRHRRSIASPPPLPLLLPF